MQISIIVSIGAYIGVLQAYYPCSLIEMFVKKRPAGNNPGYCAIRWSGPCLHLCFHTFEKTPLFDNKPVTISYNRSAILCGSLSNK